MSVGRWVIEWTQHYLKTCCFRFFPCSSTAARQKGAEALWFTNIVSSTQNWCQIHGITMIRLCTFIATCCININIQNSHRRWKNKTYGRRERFPDYLPSQETYIQSVTNRHSLETKRGEEKKQTKTQRTHNTTQFWANNGQRAILSLSPLARSVDTIASNCCGSRMMFRVFVICCCYWLLFLFLWILEDDFRVCMCCIAMPGNTSRTCPCVFVPSMLELCKCVVSFRTAGLFSILCRCDALIKYG